MSEKIWIEIIKILPSLLWIGFGVVVLFTTRRILESQAHRLQKVGTPFLNVEFAQQLLEDAQHEGSLHVGTAAVPEMPDVPPQAPHGGAVKGRAEKPTVDLDPPVGPDGPGAPSGSAEIDWMDAKSYAREPSGDAPSTPAPRQRTKLTPRSLTRTSRRLVQNADAFKGRSVLWVDDVPTNNYSLMRLLNSMGATVHTARSTRQALDYLQAFVYDVVITDLRRTTEEPVDTAGMTLVRSLREEGIGVPVVFYTAQHAVLPGVPDGAAGSTDRADELVNILIDLLSGVRPRR
ncbi:response regulator [Salininema proteolyticum]|uniref:Response regulator n=1 Tax=Salininema proteolyticum TaxID=1607685 RepID=A0ABV8TUZ6_9ACTN